MFFFAIGVSRELMKTGRSICAAVTRALLFITLLAPSTVAAAQSGRVVTPPLAPAAPPPPASPIRPKAKRAAAAGADEYKLVFTTSYAGKRFYRTDKERKELALATRSELDNFLAELNKVGAQGYKLTSAIYRGFPVGLARLDEAEYEYTGFDTTTKVFFGVGAFEERYAQLARQGFRLADHFFIDSYCEYADPDNSALGQNCEYTRRFLFEREKEGGKPGHYALAASAPGRRDKPSDELSSLINKGLSEGFYPTILLNSFVVLLEQPAQADERPTDRPEVQVVRASGLDGLSKQINELAKQGYRLALTDNGIALMVKRVETATPVKYVWLKAQDKNFDKQLALLQAGGAVYRMIGTDDAGEENSLVFEQGPTAEGRRREYRVLKFDFQFAENAAEGKMYISLARPSQETMKVLNGLVKEGFTVRDLFVAKEVGVILERSL